MKKYYVNLPGVGTTDAEFQQVLDLLISKGYKADDRRVHGRVTHPDGSFEERGFLYLFDDLEEAERFAQDLRDRTGNPSWKVFEVDFNSIKELIDEHREHADEPLVLAMYYDGEDPGDVYLLEVIENFGSNGINPDRELFELTYWAPNGKSGGVGQTWHLVLTNPPEFEMALRQNWKHVERIRSAVKAGRYDVIYMNGEEGVQSRELIHG
jgi:hypothetical protein